MHSFFRHQDETSSKKYCLETKTISVNYIIIAGFFNANYWFLRLNTKLPLTIGTGKISTNFECRYCMKI